MVEGVLIAAAYLGFGIALISGAWFVAVAAWIRFGPSDDAKRAKAYRVRPGTFDLRSYMGMK